MSRTRTLLFLWSSLIPCFASTAAAQPVVDPAFVEFTVSADHATVDATGQALVMRYDFLLYAQGALTPARVVNLGKPAPGAQGTVRIALASIVSSWPTNASVFQVRIAAVGPFGSSPSQLSNSFSFQSTTCTYAVSPLTQSIVRAGGTAAFAVTAPAGCNWSASTQASWLTISSGANGTGNGTATFLVQPNASTQPRSASATIAGVTVTLVQAISTPPNAPTGMRIVR